MFAEAPPVLQVGMSTAPQQPGVAHRAHGAHSTEAQGGIHDDGKVEHKGKPTIQHQSSIQDQILHSAKRQSSTPLGNPASLHHAGILVIFDVRLPLKLMVQRDYVLSIVESVRMSIG